jgi:hypothetical protein
MPVEWDPTDADDQLRRQFGAVGSNAPTAPYNIHSIKVPVRSALSKGQDYIYVYLRPSSDGGTILWDGSSIKVETIFTPSRLQ